MESTSVPSKHFIIQMVILLESKLGYSSTVFLFPLFLYEGTTKKGKTTGNRTELHK